MRSSWWLCLDPALTCGTETDLAVPYTHTHTHKYTNLYTLKTFCRHTFLFMCTHTPTNTHLNHTSHTRHTHIYCHCVSCSVRNKHYQPNCCDPEPNTAWRGHVCIHTPTHIHLHQKSPAKDSAFIMVTCSQNKEK